jgi:hypothetical protein
MWSVSCCALSAGCPECLFWPLPKQERVYAGADETVQHALARLNLLREDEGGRADGGGRVRARFARFANKPCCP